MLFSRRHSKIITREALREVIVNPLPLPFEMSSRDLFFDAVDIGAVKAEHGGAHLGGSEQAAGARRREGREGEGGVMDVGLTGQQHFSPPQTPLQRASAPATATVVAAPPATPPPPPPPAASLNPITASELRLAASAALRLACEAIDALHGLKEVVLEIADDVRELLEATRRAGGGGLGRRRRRSTPSTRLGVRTRAQARRRR